MENVRRVVACLALLCLVVGGSLSWAAPPFGLVEVTRVVLRVGDLGTTGSASVSGTICTCVPLDVLYGFRVFGEDDPCGWGYLGLMQVGQVDFCATAPWIARSGPDGSVEYAFFTGPPSVDGRLHPLLGGDALQEYLDRLTGCLYSFEAYCDTSLCSGDLVPLGAGDFDQWAASNAVWVNYYITVVLVGSCSGLGDVIQWVGYYRMSVSRSGEVSLGLVGADSGDVSALQMCVQGWVGSGDNETSSPYSGQNPPSGGENPPSGGENPPPGGENPPPGGENPPPGGENPPPGGENPPPGGENPPPGGENPPPGGENPPPGGENPPQGPVDGVPVPPAGGPSGGVPTSPEVPGTGKAPGDVVRPTPGHPCFGGYDDSVYFVAPADYQPRTEFGESVVWRSGDACDFRDVIVSGDVYVSNSGDSSNDSVFQLVERVKSGAGVSRVVVPRFQKDYVVVRQRLSDAVAACDGVVRVVEQTASGWDRPELLEAAGRQDLLFTFGGEVPELYRVEELEVSVIRERLAVMGEGSVDGQALLSAILESSDRPSRAHEVRGSVVVCDRSAAASDVGTSVSASSRDVDAAFSSVERRLRTFADSMSAGLVTALSVEPCAVCPPLPVPSVTTAGKVVWAEDRNWCGPLSASRGSLRLGVGAGVLVAILGLWLRFWSYLTGGDGS